MPATKPYSVATLPLLALGFAVLAGPTTPKLTGLPTIMQKLLPAPPPLALNEVVRAAAFKHNIDAKLVKSIIKAESAFVPTAVSEAGAVGLMQLMPETAQELGYDPLQPEQNVQAGAEYLSSLVDRYKGKRNGLQLAIAAYNAGPGNVDRFRGVPPFRETRTYVKRVMTYFKEFRRNDAPVAYAQPPRPADPMIGETALGD